MTENGTGKSLSFKKTLLLKSLSCSGLHDFISKVTTEPSWLCTTITALFHVITEPKPVSAIRKCGLEEPQEFLIFVLLHLSSYKFQ